VFLPQGIVGLIAKLKSSKAETGAQGEIAG
jgi:hypothetical protein